MVHLIEPLDHKPKTRVIRATRAKKNFCVLNPLAVQTINPKESVFLNLEL